ncbi:MAG: chemotaxis protein CheA [Elusimicrobia bacterium]|nr:chemotaxis protein CheA [Elusimicrobiota bacterium]
MTDTNDSAKGTPSVIQGAEPLLLLKSLVAAVDPNDQLSLLKLMRWFKEIPASIPPDTKPMLDEARLLVLRMTGNDRTPEKTLADLAALVDRVVKSVETKAAPPPAAATPAPAAVVSPEEETPADQDRLLFPDFIPEAGEHLQAAESALLTLEKAPSDPDAINTVFRAFHTLKGMAGYVHLRFCTDLAHHAESLLSKVREKEMAYGPGIADLSLRSIDVMKFLIESVQAASQSGSIKKPTGYDELLSLLKNATEKGVVDPPARSVGSSSPAPAAPSTAAAPPPPQAARAGGDTNMETTVRVRTDRLDRLVNAVGELVIAQSMITQDPIVTAPDNGVLSRKVAHLDRVVRDLRDLAMALRLVPMKGPFQKASRAIRDVAQKSGKAVDLHLYGEEAEVDRNVVETLDQLLLHLVRNAVDHGLETPVEREQAGKSPIGQLYLSATHEGGSLVVEVREDGRGMNRDKILKKARERGLVPADRELTEDEILRLIFLPGFSTADKVTEVSGRGVGLDVVKKGIENLRGQLDVTSKAGQGSRFRLRLPLTLAVTDGMLVRVGDQTFILPILNIRQTVRPEKGMISTVTGRGELLNLRGEMVPIFRLRRVLGLSEEGTEDGLLIIVEDQTTPAALWVDDLLGQQQVVTKSLGTWFGQVPGVSGGAILGDGKVGLILDPAEVVRLARTDAPVPLPVKAQLSATT